MTMAHYAKVNAITKKVENVIKAEQDFINRLPDSGFWVQTSYNTHHGQYYNPQPTPETQGQGYRAEDLAPAEEQYKALRWNFAVIGGTYDADKDAFIPVKPFPSWVLDETIMDWKAPVDYPQDAHASHLWDEETKNWIHIE
jgi:hypothetical protein